MKFLLLTAFVVTIWCYVHAGKTQRLLAALNAGMLTGMNGGMVNGASPGMMVGRLNPPVVAGGGAGFIGQPQFAQFISGVPAFAVSAPISNVYPVPAVNALPFIGVPQMAPLNPPQQPPTGITSGALPQQLPLLPDPLRRFRRQIMNSENNSKANVDTQIPAPTESTTTKTVPCDDHREEN